MAVGEGLIFRESGTILQTDDQVLYPETKIIERVTIVDDSCNISEADARIMKLAREELGCDYYDIPFEYYELGNAYDHKDVWVTRSWLPSGKRSYVRFYWKFKSLDRYPTLKTED